MGNTKSDLYDRILAVYPEITRRRISVSLIPTTRDEVWTIRLKSRKSEVFARILRSSLAVFTEGVSQPVKRASLGQIIAWMD